MFGTFATLAGISILVVLIYFGMQALQLQSQLAHVTPVSSSSPVASAIVTATETVVDAPLTRVPTPNDSEILPTPSPVLGGSPEDVVQRTMQSVVRIQTSDAEGTGFVFRQRRSDALFLTNAHVVEGTTTVKVVTSDGNTHSGVVLARDTRVDLAIVSVKDLAAMTPLPLGDSKAVKAGEQIYVIGYPLGSALKGDATVTRGIISGQRTVKDITYIQTDAAVNPGNSGGPVIDAVGRVVGVATWRIGELDVQGISFAIPSQLVQSTADTLLASNPTAASAQTDLWLKISNEDGPRARGGHVAVWTGKEMIIWGGLTSGGVTRTGARYDPETQKWKPTSTTGAPSARLYPASVWTGQDLIVWGGAVNFGSAGFLSDGARYDPATDKWTPLPKSPLSPRAGADAIWTGKDMIVWGGIGGSFTKATLLGDGARYNPATNTWTMLPAAHEPSARVGEAAAWTGRDLFIWGGHRLGAGTELGDGALYDPQTNSWKPLPMTDAPSPRWGQSATWTGSVVIVWGGAGAKQFYDDGALYNPEKNVWTPISSAGITGRRWSHNALWTGSDMIVFGGLTSEGTFAVSGARYDPSKDQWTSLPLTPLDPRIDYSVVWTGKSMIVWGGYYFQGDRNKAAFSFFDDGAVYLPGQ